MDQTKITKEYNLLIVDDELPILRCLKAVLRNENYTVHTAANGHEGLELLSQHQIGVVLSDINMPEMDGITFLEKCRSNKPDMVRLVLTANTGIENALEMINRSHVFGYLTKPWSNETLKQTLSVAFNHHHLLMENKNLYNLVCSQNTRLQKLNENLEIKINKRTRQLETAIEDGIIMLANAAEAKDDDTGEHVVRLKKLVEKICRGLGLSEKETYNISQASVLHDVGKIHIPDHILKKPGSLSDEEFDLMKTHTLIGARILGNSTFYKTAREIARSHHERYDGSGYPDGLKKEEIPLSARIVAVADVFDALSNKRPYKPAWPQSKALDEIASQAGTQFDPDVAEVLLDLFNHKPGIAKKSTH